MNLYDRLKVQKLFKQFMWGYITEIQLICDSLAGCGHFIEEMQHIYIILNGVKSQYINVVSIIHVSWNPYDLASIRSLLIDAKVREKEIIFDNSLSAPNMVIKPSTDVTFLGCVCQSQMVAGTLDSGESYWTYLPTGHMLLQTLPLYLQLFIHLQCFILSTTHICLPLLSPTIFPHISHPTLHY